MNCTNETVVRVFHIVAQWDGNQKEALFTINRLEMQQFMFNVLHGLPECLLHIKQYDDTLENFKKDLEKLTSEVLRADT